MTNRSYQDDNCKSILDTWEKHSSILYQLPTGGGKTVVINTIIENFLDEKILILVHRQEIIFQIRDRLKARGVDVGVLIGGYEENTNADILIASVLTVARDTRLQGILDRNFDRLIIDEAHHCCSDSYIKVITSFKQYNPNYKLLGVTATPYRKDGKKLSNLFDVLIKGPTYSELRKDGYLADYVCYAAKLDNLKDLDASGGDYKISSLSKYMRAPALINKAVEMYRRNGKGKQMLVFCVDKKHSLQVKQAYIDAGFTRIAHIDSDTPDEERKQINQDYRDGNIDIITSVQTLTEGVDLPETGVVQLVRPTMSIVLYLQMIGRGTRLKSDGSKLIVLDCSNCSYEHGLLDSNFEWSLNNKEPNPDKKLNKIVGKSKKGSYTIDEEEIEMDDLEITEITHDEYLSQNENGIEIAESENKEKDELILNGLTELVAHLNEKCKVDDVNFSFHTGDLINYHMFDEIKCTFKQNPLFKLKYRAGSFSLHTEYRFASGTAPVNFDKFVAFGKTTELLAKDNIKKYIVLKWLEINDINKSKVDINQLKGKIKDIKKAKCIVRIDELLAAGQHIFKMKNEVYAYSYNFRDIWGRWISLSFTDKPKRLKSTNKITFLDNDGNRIGSHSAVKKDQMIDMLYKEWYVND